MVPISMVKIQLRFRSLQQYNYKVVKAGFITIAFLHKLVLRATLQMLG